MNLSKSTLYIIAAAAVIVIGFILYFLLMPKTPQPTAPQQPTSLQNLPPESSGNTTTDIANDLSQIPDDSAALNQDFNSLDKNIQGF